MKLEIGTEIAERYNGKIRSFKKITRVTATRADIKISDTAETCLRIEASEDGYVREFSPQKWSQTSYRVATGKDKAELKIALSIQELKNTEWAKLPEGIVFQIFEIIKNVSKP